MLLVEGKGWLITLDMLSVLLPENMVLMKPVYHSEYIRNFLFFAKIYSGVIISTAFTDFK